MNRKFRDSECELEITKTKEIINKINIKSNN